MIVGTALPFLRFTLVDCAFAPPGVGQYSGRLRPPLSSFLSLPTRRQGRGALRRGRSYGGGQAGAPDGSSDAVNRRRA